MLSPIQSFEYYGGSSDYVAKYTDSSGNVYYFVLNSDGTVTEYTSLGYKYITYNRSSRKGYMFGGFWIKVEEQ